MFVFDLEKTVSLKVSELKKLFESKIIDVPSVTEYLIEIKNYPIFISYKYRSQNLNNKFDCFFRNDKISYVLFQKLALCTLIKDNFREKKFFSFPQRIQLLYTNYFKRIIYELDLLPDDYYHHANDGFQKDFSICALRSIPVGGAWMVVHSGTGYAPLFRGSYSQRIKFLFFLILKMKGTKPFYLMHVIQKCVEGFNESEWLNCFHNIYDLLKINKEMKGWLGRSWYYDPELEKISPRLSYLRKVPEGNGAALFKIGSFQDDILNATAKSLTRKQLHIENRYLPTKYLIVWPRNEIFKWATTARHNNLIKDQ